MENYKKNGLFCPYIMRIKNIKNLKRNEYRNMVSGVCLITYSNDLLEEDFKSKGNASTKITAVNLVPFLPVEGNSYKVM